MVTADSVKAKLQGLITAANTKTGNSDADLTTAVNTLIDGFGQGGVKLPEIDESVLGSASDLVSGKQLIDANGNIVTGELLEKTSFYKTGAAVSYEEPIKNITLVTNTDSDMVLRAGKRITLYAKGSNFGDASASDVAKGKTFTSQNGLKVVGIREDDGGGVSLPTLTTPGTADDLAKGKQFIDANGNVVTGTVVTVGSGVTHLVDNARIIKMTSGGNLLLGTDLAILDPRLFRSGSNIKLLTPAENFGDATAADVAAGKTFTSAEGHKVVGTMAPGGGFTVTDDGAGNVTITSSAITDNNGDVVIA